MPPLATRLTRVQTAGTIGMAARARALRASGIDVLSLALGEPDVPTPAHVIAAANAAALRGETTYPPIAGTLALKQAIQRKFVRDHDLAYGLDEIAICNGGKQVIYNALMATVDAGDEVVIPTPCYGGYAPIVLLAGGVPVSCVCSPEDGFRLRPANLAACITPRTRWVILNFPNNPTGAVCAKADLAALAAMLLDHPKVWVLCDDIYEYLVYDEMVAANLVAVQPRLRNNVLIVSGVSKSYAMTGWRIGFCGGPAALVAGIVAMQGHISSGACSISQAAAAAALDGPQDTVSTQKAAYRQRCDLMLRDLAGIAGLTCYRPAGAFYLFVGIAGWLGRFSANGTPLGTDEDVALALLNEQHVACVHGAAFGMSPYLRLSFACDRATLAEACRRIRVFAEGLGD